jgi:hypothetical protein
MKKSVFLFFFTFFLFKNSIFAQKTMELSKTTYFKSGSAELADSSKTALLDLVTSIKMAGTYEISIEAFTDTDGSTTFNQELSAQRANSVRAFLGQNGIDLTYTEAQGFGEEKSVFENQSEDNKAKNRRVNTRVKVSTFESLGQIFASAQSNNGENFVISNQRDTMLYGAQGTIVAIPANVFEFENGKKPTGEIKFKLIEVYEYSDMIMNDLHTMTENALLETGGMVYLEAQSENKPLRITEGKEIQISLPSKKEVKNDMELFYTQHTANTNNNFVQTDNKKRFSWRRAGRRPTFKPLDKDADCIKGLDRSCFNKVRFQKPNHKVVPLPEYKRVVEPREPQKPTTPTFSSKQPQKPALLLQDYAKLSKKEKKLYKNQEIEYNAKLVSYTESKEKYQKRLDNYPIQMEHYSNVLMPKYLAEKANFEAKIHEIAKAIKENYFSNADVEVYKFLLQKKSRYQKGCIEDFLKQPDFNTEIGSYFIGQKSSITQKYYKGKVFQEYINFFGEDITEKYFKKEDTDVKYLLTQEEKVEMAEKIKRDSSFFYEDYLAEKAKSIATLNENTSLLAAINIINRQIQGMKDKLLEELAQGKGSTKLLSNYVFGISKLGWINCDRFTNYPENEKMFVDMKGTSQEKDEKVFLVFNQIKSVISLGKTVKNSWASEFLVPRNEPATIVAIKYSEGKAYVGFSKTTPQSADYQKINYEKMNSLQELREKLKSLNII